MMQFASNSPGIVEDHQLADFEGRQFDSVQDYWEAAVEGFQIADVGFEDCRPMVEVESPAPQKIRSNISDRYHCWEISARYY
jgi:hypothetical protein